MSASFEETYRDQRLPLVRLAYLLCGSREQSEDVVQTAFTAAHTRWDDVRDPGPYLRRAVVNLVKDGQRRHFRWRGLVGEPETVTHLPELDETWAVVQSLPQVQRAVVVLHFYEDLPLTEIAEVLDRPPGTVRSDLHRALARLRKALS